MNIHSNPHKHWLFKVFNPENTQNQYKTLIEPTLGTPEEVTKAEEEAKKQAESEKKEETASNSDAAE